MNLPQSVKVKSIELLKYAVFVVGALADHPIIVFTS